MPRIYEEKNLTLSFNDTNDFDEIKVAREIFRKFDTISKKAGFKQDFTPTEIEFIREISSALNPKKEHEKT